MRGGGRIGASVSTDSGGCPFLGRFRHASPDPLEKLSTEPGVHTAPGPSGWPWLGSYPAFLWDRPGFFESIARTYGDVVHFRLGRDHYYQLNHPDLIRDFFVSYYDYLEKAGVMVEARPVLGDALFTAEGDAHRRQRRMVQPAFTPAGVRLLTAGIPGHVSRYTASWRSGQEIDLARAMNGLAVAVAGRTLFGEDLLDDSERLTEAMLAILDYLNPVSLLLARVWPGGPIPGARRYREARALFESVVAGIIARGRRGDGGGSSILERLIESIGSEAAASEKGVRFLRDQVMTMLLAGHETVATTLTWTLYLLSKNPVVERAFHAEVDALGPHHSVVPTDTERLPLTQRILKESMRLYPAGWALKRRVIRPFSAGRHRIPAGSFVGVSQFVMHRDPRFYPHPLAFDPSRWTEEESRKRPVYCYFPFGGGPRSCVGAGFAMTEAALILATVGKRWRFRLLSTSNVGRRGLITLRPNRKIRMMLERRTNLDD